MTCRFCSTCPRTGSTRWRIGLTCRLAGLTFFRSGLRFGRPGSSGRDRHRIGSLVRLHGRIRRLVSPHALHLLANDGAIMLCVGRRQRWFLISGSLSTRAADFSLREHPKLGAPTNTADSRGFPKSRDTFHPRLRNQITLPDGAGAAIIRRRGPTGRLLKATALHILGRRWRRCLRESNRI